MNTRKTTRCIRIKLFYYFRNFLLPPTNKKWATLNLATLEPPHDGNPSTCGYLGVIWTPWRDSNSQIGLIPLSLCRERRSKKVTHFRLYGNVRTWHGQIQELKGGFNRGYGGHWAADGKPNSPPSLPYTTATMRVHAGRDSAPEPKITIIPSFLLREWKQLLFLFLLQEIPPNLSPPSCCSIKFSSILLLASLVK